MEPARPAVLLLDVMSTLVHDPFHVEVPEFLGLSFEELLEAKHPTAWAEFERSEIDEATLYARFFRDGRAFDGPGMKARMARSFRLLEGIEPLLEELAAQVVPMHALSNYPEWYHLVEGATGLARFLKWTFVSCDTGLRKPDPEAYRHAARELGLPLAACLFVDDKQRNVAAARALGMDAVRFEDAATLRTALAERGLLGVHPGSGRSTAEG